MDLAERVKVVSQRSWASWGVVVFLWAAFAYVWLLPLIRPRGLYLWGHYRLSDIFIGFPVGLATICATVVVLMPKQLRRKVALRLVTLCIAILAIVFAFDAVYTFGLLKIWQPNMYFDQSGVSRQHNLPDPDLGFVRKPNLSWHGSTSRHTRKVDFRTDQSGFRNAPGIERADIVFIGDSYTEAPQVPEEETFVQLVGEGTGQTVANLGISAYGPQQAVVVLQRYGVKYQPKVAVWAIFEGNDLGDAQSYALFRDNPGKAFVSLKQRYLDNSLMNRLFSLTLAEVPVVGRAAATMRFTDGSSQNVHLIYPAAMDQPVKKAVGMAETIKSIEAAHAICKSNDIKLVVVFLPAMVRVMAPYLTFADQSGHDRFLTNDVVQHDTDFGSRVRKLASDLGITFVDGFSVLRRQALIDNRKLFILNDEHLDTEGHKIIAAEIIKALP